MKDVLLVYSGGMDSTVLLHEHSDRIAMAVSFNYGSKHNDIEFEYAQKNTLKLQIPIIRIDLTSAFSNFKSDLLKNGGDIPEGHYEDESMKATVVPFRNGIMLSVAAGLAESLNLSCVMIANHFGDHAIYPDCRQSFIEPMKNAIIEGTYNRIELQAPFTNLSKREVAFIGKELGVDFSLTYSCYKGGDIHCGKCGTCSERKEALADFDPTQYEGDLL